MVTFHFKCSKMCINIQSQNHEEIHKHMKRDLSQVPDLEQLGELDEQLCKAGSRP